MPSIDAHRKVAAENMEIHSLLPPFSFFDFAEDRFSDDESIRRVFSLARASNAGSLVVEKIPATGMIEEENQDILSIYPQYKLGGLFRLTFWKRDHLAEEGIAALSDDDLVGYVILKEDNVGGAFDGWHIFEAVFKKYPHSHNCVPLPQTYDLMACGKPFSIQGILYCQQNTLNKTCAQVAIRSLLSRILPEGDISYRTINEIAKTADSAYTIGKGLLPLHFEKILEHFGLRYHDIDYSVDTTDPPEVQAEKKQLRTDSPYQKFAYSGLESGGGALVGFRFTKESGKTAGHIIPVYGHTFNKDNWAPDASFSYFKIGSRAGYLPSETWTSSFIGHDDNFGPNFCIPRLYIDKDNVDYVLEIFRPGIRYSGIQAEALALNIFNMIINNLKPKGNRWISRLQFHSYSKRLVFRALSLKKEEYIGHLRSIRDWEGNEESKRICDFIDAELPQNLWVVEVSTPQLFPANKRKLGEVVLNGEEDIIRLDGSVNDDLFIFARLPSVYMIGSDVDQKGVPTFSPVPSDLTSHTDLFRL